MILFLDTSGFEQLHFALVKPDGKIVQQKVKVIHHNSEKTLAVLKIFLQKNKAFGKLAKIYLVSGPGSFSGIRVGAAMALAFGFVWKIPVLAIKKEQTPKKLSDLPKVRAKKVGANFEPDYGQPAKISKEKPKNLRNT